MSGDVVVAGVAEAGVAWDAEMSVRGIQANAGRAALADACLSWGDVDGLFTCKGLDIQAGERPAAELAEYLGLRPRYLEDVLTGGCGPLMLVQRAAAAVVEGRCDVALLTYGSAQRSARRRKAAGPAQRPESHVARAERAAGLPVPIGPAALAATRHMHQFGTTQEQLANVVVAARAWAALNPTALLREPVDVDDVLTSPLLCDPLHRMDVCMVSDGGAAAVLTRRERLDDASRAVSVLGAAEAHSHATAAGAADLATTVAGDCASRALRDAGAERDDVDIVQIYDAFSIMPIILLEDLGFCAKGEGGPFVASGATRPGGALPMNTQGGGLAHCHPGVYGMFQVVEAVRQLRKEAGQRNVPRAEIGMCHASGGGSFGGAHATVVLGAAR